MPAIKLSDTPLQNQETAARMIDDSMYVMDPETSELHAFNEIGSRIFALIDGRRSVREVVDAIVAEHDVDEATARRDVVEFLAELRDKNLISV